MKVIDFVRNMANSDLRQIALRDIGTGANTDTLDQQNNMNALIAFVNQGLVELHRRFPVKVGTQEVDVDLYPTISQGLVELGAVKLPDDAFSLIGVTTDDYVDVPVDDKNLEFQYTQGAYHKLFVRSVAINTYVISGDNEDKVRSLYFNYLAAPEVVGINDTIPLPMSFFEALQNYVAYRGYSTIKSVTQIGDEGLTYLKKFENSCDELSKVVGNVYDYDDFDYKNLWKKGFV